MSALPPKADGVAATRKTFTSKDDELQKGIVQSRWRLTSVVFWNGLLQREPTTTAGRIPDQLARPMGATNRTRIALLHHYINKTRPRNLRRWRLLLIG